MVADITRPAPEATPDPEPRLTALSARLDHHFADPMLLALAVTHRSYCAENAGFEPNERLEFLGDAVLSIVVTDHIFWTYPEMPEGELAKLRAALVSAATLAEIAYEVSLGDALRLGKGEDASGGRQKSSILADGMEAVFGAVYLDGGMEAARSLILHLLRERIVQAANGPGGHDYKTQLQELAARQFEELPTYDLRDEGPDHEKRFFATVHLQGRAWGDGEGRSKKLAEQSAAQSAFETLTRQLTRPVVRSADEGSTIDVGVSEHVENESRDA